MDPQVATSLVFLPAIPSWLPLWSLLSPEDATSGGGGDGGAGGSRSGPVPLSVATIQAAGEEPRSPEGTATAKAGRSSGDASCYLSNDCGTRGRRGAVRLVQTVAALQTPYRYAAVLHFWGMVSGEGGRGSGLSWYIRMLLA